MTYVKYEKTTLPSDVLDNSKDKKVEENGCEMEEWGVE
jgi:hypothetical protein